MSVKIHRSWYRRAKTKLSDFKLIGLVPALIAMILTLMVKKILYVMKVRMYP
jgi:hypothetical protein